MSRPVRLDKQDNGHNSFSFNLWCRIEAWAIAHATILIPLFVIIGLFLFIMLCYTLCGVSAVESGTQYRMESWI